MAKQQKCPDCAGVPPWITTFSDLMSLLLTFFVLLLSFSSVDQDDFENAIGALQGALGVLDGKPILTSPVKLHVPIVKGDITEARPTMKDAKADIETITQEERQQQNVQVSVGDEGITIRIRDRAAFDSGRSQLK
ncbi:MAG: flagellar motor protein MotB, partial [Gemmatimonadota bacterium]